MITSQYKQKKKRAVDPNAPPRPNLLNHEKRMKESDAKLASQAHVNERMKKELDRAVRRISDLEQQLNNLIAVLNRQASSGV